MEITATEFKSKCLQLMDRVHNKLEEVVITKHGKPIAKLVPAGEQVEPTSPVGYMRGRLTIKEDLIKPLGIDWNF